MIIRGSEEWLARRDQLLSSESAQPVRWHYCSFANDAVGFLGGLFIQGRGILSVAAEARRKGLNPGGEMICIALSDDEPMPVEKYRNVLLTKEQLEEACGPLVKSDGSDA